MLLLYRQSYPSVALILVSDVYTLVVSGSASGSGTKAGGSCSPQVEIRLEPIASFDVFGCTLLGRVYGCLGLVQLAGEIFLAVASQAVLLTSRYSDPARPDEVCKITAVDFYAVSSASWDQHGSSSGGGGGEQEGSGASTPTSLASVTGGNPDAYAHDGYGQASGAGGGAGQVLEHPASALRKILSNGRFYFSSPSSTAAGAAAGGVPFDVSTRLEERLLRSTASSTAGDASATPESVAYDPRFVWNGFLLESLLTFRTNLSSTERSAFDGSGFIVAIIQGYYGLHDFTLSGNPVTLSLISRLGFARAGTRFNTRGIDDDGHVANFVETETMFRTKDSVFSFVQIRGSVPLFWEQQGTTPFGGQRLQVTRPSVSSQPAFNKHFRALLESYPAVQALNLLSQKEHESLLSVTYREHVRNFNAQMSGQAATTTSTGEPDEDAEGREREIGYTEFDFHNKARLAGGIESVRELIRRDPETGGKVERFGYCVAAVHSGESGSNASRSSKNDTAGGAKETILSRQEGVFRTNCLDCLDRTNVVQDILSRLAIETYLMHNFPAWRNSDILLGFHRTLWAENGDALSHMYAGTGALNTSFTRSGKRTLAGALSDATKSVSRMYISNFVDKGKQQAIDALLGNLTNQQKVVVVDPVRDDVDSALAHRASEYTSKRQYTIFCGTFNVNGKTPGNESLLSWLFPDPKTEPDIIALGFQELVELSPQQIMATDPAKLRQWQTYLLSALSERGSKHDYVLLRAEQLVGTALILLVKTSVAPHVRHVEAAAKKTGLKGMAGNKGAVAVRLELDDSEFCFVTAHFAAGHSNFEQRNLDYDTIASGLHFRRGRKMAAHENILYFGDLNYRIQLSNEEARSLAQQDACSKLVAADQLSTCMREKRVFVGFSEGPLVFRPTYKYDNGSDVYDSSEKQRIPSWTDRILYRGTGLDLLRYNRAELMLSDHRPVYGIFKADVKVIDHGKKEAIARELLASLSPSKVRSQTATQKAMHKLLDNDAGKQDDSARDPERISADIDPNWWQKVDYAQIAQSAKQARPQQPRQTSNPFRTGSDVSSPSRKSTGDSLQQSRRPIPPAQLPPRPTSASSQRSRASSLNDPLSADTAGVSLPLRSLPDGNIVKRKAVPPIVPGNKPQLPARTASQSSLGVSPASPKSPSISNGSAAPAASSTLRPAGRPELNRKASTSSLLDEDDREGAGQAVLRPSTRREATTEWQVIARDPARGK